MKPWTRWKDWLNGIVGLWLLVSPWILGVSGNSAILWSAVILGVLIAVAAVWALASPSVQVAEWSNIVLGVVTFISPSVLGFTAESAAAWNAWIVGAVAVVLAAWALPDVKNASDYEHTPGKHTNVG